MENTKNTKEARERADLINKINNRAYELGIMYGSRLNHTMDIDYATQVFNIDLEAWLDSADTDFMHDYVGIYRNIDRDAISLKHSASQNDFGRFVPRFAKRKNENNLIKDCYESYKLLKLEKKIHESAILFQIVALILAEMMRKKSYGLNIVRNVEQS